MYFFHCTYISLFIILCFVLLSPQSYALYILRDEKATSTDVSKYLTKLSAGVCVILCPLALRMFNIALITPQDCVCFWLNPTDCVCECKFACEHLLTTSLFTCRSHSFLLSKSKGPVVCSDAGFQITWFNLFVFARTKNNCVEVTAFAAGNWSAFFKSQKWSLTLWVLRENLVFFFFLVHFALFLFYLVRFFHQLVNAALKIL